MVRNNLHKLFLGEVREHNGAGNAACCLFNIALSQPTEKITCFIRLRVSYPPQPMERHVGINVKEKSQVSVRQKGSNLKKTTLLLMR
jgi:hypothetical protein